MKVLCVNLPNKDRIVRRFCGSYNSPSFLFPPQELLSCAAALKSWNKAEVFVVDAIAEKRDLDSTIDFIRQKNPDMVVTMIGMECFSDDIKVVTSIKSSNPGAKMTVFGYYPSMFSREVFKNTNIDYIVQPIQWCFIRKNLFFIRGFTVCLRVKLGHRVNHLL